MIEHIGMLKFESFTTKSQKDMLISKLQNLGELIPSVAKIKAGYNFSGKNKGFDIGISAQFENRNDLEDFLKHPLHIEVASFSKEIGLKDIITVDFTF